MIEEKLTCENDFNEAILEKKRLRDELFEVKLDIVYNKNDIEKSALLKEKEQIIKKKIAKIVYKIKLYEVEKTQEKERRKK